MKLFSYDSKPMQVMATIGDLIILNVAYILCCLPIFTIGAAQAGLYNGVKVLLDKEDDSSAIAAYFKGFTDGFLAVTIGWGLLTVILATVLLLSVTAYTMGSPLWILIIAVALCALLQTLVPAFHSRFKCTAFQLIRNAWFLLFAHPLRSTGAVLLVWLPVIAFLVLDAYSFMALTPLWVTLYFSTAFCFAFNFLKKPFKTLTDHFNETHGIQPEGSKETTDAEDDSECEEEYDDYDEEYEEDCVTAE